VVAADEVEQVKGRAVVAKRLKYCRVPWQGDSNHFHYRFHRIGFS